MASSESQSLPERPKGEETGAPSKNALKKAAKDKEKAEKAAKRQEQERLEKEKTEASDTSKHLYGKLAEGIPDPSKQKSSANTTLRDLNEELENKEVTVRARVHNARVQSAKLAFLDLRQRTENLQAVIAEGGENGISRQMVKWCGGLNKESIVLVTGLVKKPKEPINSATISNLEMHVESCFVVSEGPMQLPMQVKDAMHPPPVGDEAETEDQADSQGVPVVSLNVRLNNRVLSLRTPTDQAIFQINGAICELFREHLLKQQFQELQTPKIAGAATEGGSGVFEINYFNTPAFLTQSPQFYKQMAIAGDMERVFEIGPVFRAENSNTARHLTEFTGLDFEMEIHNTWEEIIDFAEGLLIFIFNGLRERCTYWMEVIQREYPDAGNFKIPEGRAPRIRFADGIKLLNEAGIDASPDEDISTTNEKSLGRLILQKYHTDFYFLTHYPTAARPFYTHLDPGNAALTHSYDAFMRGQEIVSGAQRIHDPAMLTQRMRGMEPPLDPDSEGFKHYVNAFRMGCAPHGGGGFGLNRITMLWLGLGNIRQATLFPRDPGRKAP
ncbi:hypothetical protein MMC34_002586 [Xylographa carneopallida]|nr:hypothetical protein [Xylographa carneopallida]